MRHSSRVFSGLCVLGLLFFSCFMIWYIPSFALLENRITEAELSLETSQGRENKQQYEYDQVVGEIPLVREQIAQAVPLASEAEETVAGLKSMKKELRNRKKELESELAGLNQEDTAHE